MPGKVFDVRGMQERKTIALGNLIERSVILSDSRTLAVPLPEGGPPQTAGTTLEEVEGAEEERKLA